MSKFLSSLKVEELEDVSHDGRGTWQLLDDLVYESDVAETTFTIPAGFVTDYASVPRIPVTYLLAGDTAHQAAVVHDWLYTTHQVERNTADSVLKEAAEASGIPSWRANILYAGVRAGGGFSWNAEGPEQPEKIKEILNEIYQNHRPVDSGSKS